MSPFPGTPSVLCDLSAPADGARVRSHLYRSGGEGNLKWSPLLNRSTCIPALDLVRPFNFCMFKCRGRWIGHILSIFVLLFFGFNYGFKFCVSLLSSFWFLPFSSQILFPRIVFNICSLKHSFGTCSKITLFHLFSK